MASDGPLQRRTGAQRLQKNGGPLDDAYQQEDRLAAALDLLALAPIYRDRKANERGPQKEEKTETRKTKYNRERMCGYAPRCGISEKDKRHVGLAQGHVSIAQHSLKSRGISRAKISIFLYYYIGVIKF